MAPRNDVVPLMRAAEAERPDSATLQPNIGALIHDIGRLMRRNFERRARQTGLPFTRHQARVLLSIARHEGESQAAVAAMLDIEPIALVRMLDRLHEEGLVERHLHPTDRRVRTLWLTQAGWTALDRILAVNQQVREEACEGMSPAARAQLTGALRLIKDNLTLAEETAAAPTEAARAGARAAE
ncbi:MAG TPA: MarR family winged helix-turn-helix transcriptional regulator [Stellaceae bacterium]|jgi:DNA-binding MarR family transcriptional regulator|nr:MarR family winged helix-turn-helix transcriptional regulator [Stellaceae bacterium]